MHNRGRTKGAYKRLVVLIMAITLCVQPMRAPLKEGPFLYSAYALPPELLKARTIAELVISILAGANTAVVSPQIYTPIYANYGTSNFTIENIIDQGILSVDGMTPEQAIQELGKPNAAWNLDEQGFRTLMGNNFKTIAGNNVDTIFRIGEIANTDSVYGAVDNIGQILKNVAQNGYLTVENNLAIVGNPGTAVKVYLGDILSAAKEVLKYRTMFGLEGADVDITNLPSLDLGYNEALSHGYTTYWASPNGWMQYLVQYDGANVSLVGYKIPRSNFEEQPDQYLVGFAVKNTSSTNQEILAFYKYKNYSWNKEGKSTLSGGEVKNLGIGGMGYVNGYTYTTGSYSMPVFDSYDIAISYLNGLKSDMNYPQGTPDYATTEGIFNNPTSPAIGDNEYLDIIPQSDYIPYAESVNSNLNDVLNNPDSYNVPAITQSLISTYTVTAPSPPIVPDQPTIPEKEPNSPEQTEDVLKMTTSNLQTIFPFCIPWDIKGIFELFEAEPKAPHIQGKLVIQDMEFEIDIDFSPWNNLAALFRKLILISFILVLAISTRNLIFA